MRIDWTLLHSRVARRLFLLFLLCATLPFVISGVYALLEMDRYASQADTKRLGLIAKAYALDIAGRLQADAQLLDRELADPDVSRDTALERLRRGGDFSGRTLPLARRGLLTEAQWQRIEAGKTSLVFERRAGRIHSTGLAHRDPRSGQVLFHELSADSLWGGIADFAADASLLVRLSSGELIATSASAAPHGLDSSFATPSREWREDGERYRAARFAYPVAGGTASQSIDVVAWQAVGGPLAASTRAQMVFPLLMLSTLLVALWLSVSQIRRYLRPLDTLTSGIRRLARRDFDAPLQIDSQDEFRDLGDAFNAMAASLKREFEAVDAMAEVDRMLLESRGLETVLDALLPKITRVVGCRSACVLLFESIAAGRARVFEYIPGAPDAAPVRRVTCDPATLQLALEAQSPWMVQAADLSGDYAFATALVDSGAQRIEMHPLLEGTALAGILALGHGAVADGRPPGSRDHAGELADRLSVALSNIAHGDALYRQAHFDSLTGLPNRQLFLKQLAEELAAPRRDGLVNALAYVDLDQFKRVNDTAGHAAGDDLLAVVAQRLQDCCRGGDLVARLGGDEFAIIVRRAVNADVVRDLVERVLLALAQPLRVGPREHLISGSVGVTLLHDAGQSVADALKHADIAMYRAKESGRNRAVFFEPEMNARMEARIALESGLHRALRTGAFELHYQPIVSAADQRLAGAEALLRWPNPPAGVIGPADFIGAAEQTGLIVGIGKWVLDRACADFRHWCDRGLPLPYIAVNVSSRQLLEPDFVARAFEVLQRRGMRPAQLLIEITEGVFAEGEQVRGALKALAAHGVRLAIDDFGTGYSSLGYLRTLPIDVVKIDRSFIQDTPMRDSSVQLVRTIISMAHGLGKSVVAEGIESQAQAEFLRSSGCDSLQGYLFARPMSAAVFQRWMDEYLSARPQRFATSVAGRN